MSNQIRIRAIAYFKGVYAAKRNDVRNPYVQPLLAECWEMGFQDERNGLLEKEIFCETHS